MATNYPIARLQREKDKGVRIKGNKPLFPKKIPYQTQAKRLGTKFDGLAKSIDDWEKGAEVASDPRAVVPERALVLELIGPVAEFETAAQALGLEWLISDELREASTDLDAEEAEDEALAGGRHIFYMTMPSIGGLKKLLAMWRRFKDNRAPTPAERPFWGVFGYLKDMRGWSAQDRVDPSVTQYIRALLRSDPDRRVTIELDFWYRSEKQRRDSAIATLQLLLDEVGGELLDLIEIPEIRYQGALVSVPAEVARKLAEKDGSLARFDDVMTIRPQSEYATPDQELTAQPAAVFPTVEPRGQCIAALFDGYPIIGHAALAGRLHVHEVDVTAAEVPASIREHGTAMASLVLNGDLLAQGDSPLARPLAVVPVLTNSVAHGREATPHGKLAIGVIYRALKSLLAAGKENAALANVTIINHSLCDTNSPFVRRPSPWATLLDYFSHHHRLLFIVSAGNILQSFPVGEYSDLSEFQAADPAQREAALLNAIERAKAGRGILSPAESINSLTVGALHSEGSTNAPAYAIDPYPNLAMTNLASAIGFGVNRSVKPDLVAQGGRFAANCSNHPDGYVEIHPHSAPDLGHMVAAPSVTGDLRHTVRTAGTSNAAALLTRACHQIADAIEDPFRQDGVEWLALPTRVPILKALVAHGCSWDAIGRVLEEAYPPQDVYQWAKRRDTISKFLGFGRPQFNRVIGGDDNRITLLADDVINPEELHEYRIPLPTAMFNTKDVRSITLTLAWTSPVITTTADYRGVALKLVDSSGKRAFWDGVERKNIVQPNASTAERGTLMHLILEGRRLRKELLTGGLFVGVQARATHSSQEKADVPYALAITLEMAQSQQTNLYAEVRAALRSRVATRTRVGGRT